MTTTGWRGRGWRPPDEDAPLLRGGALEPADEWGQIRARLDVEPGGEVVLAASSHHILEPPGTGTGPAMYRIVWEYEVKSDRIAAFVELYGPTGAWSSLFSGAPGYRGTELYADLARPTHFVTLDRWTSAAAVDAYLPSIQADYARLDAQGARLTVRERRLGAFQTEEADG